MLYVYSVTRDAVSPEVEGVDGSNRFGTVTIDGVSAVYSSVPAESFSQEVIDQRANDLEWLGAIGYRHQEVVSDLMKRTSIVPLRAFTLFSSVEALRAYLHEHGEPLAKVLERLDGKQEWTLRLEFDADRWSEALAGRAESLRNLQAEIGGASTGKAFLLKKKYDEEKKRASREAEADVLAEIEREVMDKLRGQTIAETRERRGGAFPQINVLVNRDEESALQELHAELNARYEREGIIVALTGPWPPYSFAHA